MMFVYALIFKVKNNNKNLTIEYGDCVPLSRERTNGSVPHDLEQAEVLDPPKHLKTICLIIQI